MKSPDAPANDATRVSVLHSYGVLDTQAEAAFDTLASVAAGVMDAPIALVSLVDANRQWFKACHGLDLRETPRDTSFCGHVVADGVRLVVPDAHVDERFKDNPLVTGSPHVRFYAGIPLRNADGYILGTLCVIDHVARQPTNKQLIMLEQLASLVLAKLESVRRRTAIALERRLALETAQRLDVLFRAMTEGVVVQDEGGAIIFSNPASEELLGLTADQMAGRTSADPSWRAIREDGSPFPGDEHPAMVTLRTGEPCMNTLMGIHLPTGQLRWIAINSLALKPDGTTRGVLSTFRDVSIEKAAREAADRLAVQERLVTVGTLAAGVGHEINNPLTFVLANVEFVLEELRSIGGGSPSGRLQEIVGMLSDARDGAERVRKIVRGLRAFGREEAGGGPTEVERAIDLSINMAAHELRHKATVVKMLVPTPLVLADDSRLSQVLVNLLANAGQAFESSDLDRNRIIVASSVEPDGRVCISISDNGPGMSPEVRARVFDPFFTTKPPGVGTGLGLSISQSIITAAGGELQLDSATGKGTTFRVLLRPARTSILPDDFDRPRASPGFRGRVLVVDDEVALLASTRRVLEREHDVMALTDPREALRVIEGGAELDVIICDLMMPYMSGKALFEAATRARPELGQRFVFVTGGTNDASIADFFARIPNPRLEKPFSIDALRAIVRKMVDAERTPSPDSSGFAPKLPNHE